MVISFRGTASWQNVLADLQFWLTGAQLFIASCAYVLITQPAELPPWCVLPLCVPSLQLHSNGCCLPCPAPGRAFGVCACAGHPPIRGRGNWLCGTRPHVHAGFLRSWQANALNQKLLKRIRGIVYGATPKGKLPRQTVYVTGIAADRHVSQGTEPSACPVCCDRPCTSQVTLPTDRSSGSSYAVCRLSCLQNRLKS